MICRLIDLDDCAGKRRAALMARKQDLQRRLLVKKSQITAEAQRLGITYQQLLRLAEEGA